MVAYVVGYRILANGYLYFCTCASGSSAVRGELALTVFSKKEHDLGDELAVVCRPYKGIYKYFERNK